MPPRGLRDRGGKDFGRGGGPGMTRYTRREEFLAIGVRRPRSDPTDMNGFGRVTPEGTAPSAIAEQLLATGTPGRPSAGHSVRRDLRGPRWHRTMRSDPRGSSPSIRVNARSPSAAPPAFRNRSSPGSLAHAQFPSEARVLEQRESSARSTCSA